MNKITHLLVDLDGTLVDGDYFGMRMEFIFRTLLTWPVRKGLIKSFQAFRSMQEALDSHPNHQTNDVKMVRAFARSYKISETEARIILEKSVREVFPKLERHFTPVPGAADFLKWAENHYPLILATNPVWNPEAVALRVKWAGIDLKTFKSFTHAQRMHSCKPRVEYYQELLEQEELDPSSCLLIGNDFRKDLPASKVGIRVFLLDPKQEKSQASYKPIPTKKGRAPSWWGTYLGLRELLEKS